MEQMDFIKKKIRELQNEVNHYGSIEDMQWWEESIVDGINKEIEQYRSVLKSLNELEKLKKGKLEAA